MKSSVLTVSRKLKFYQLVVFDQVVQSGSLVRAAQILNMTQPAVTKVIHEIESYFSAPLLVRSNRGVRLTELGEVVLRRARAMLAELRALTDEVQAHHEGGGRPCGCRHANFSFGIVVAARATAAQGARPAGAGVGADRAIRSTLPRLDSG